MAIRLRDPRILSPESPLYKHSFMTLRCYLNCYNAELMMNARMHSAVAHAALSSHPGLDIQAQADTINDQIEAALGLLPFMGFKHKLEVSDLTDDEGRPISKQDAALVQRFAQLRKQGIIK